MAGRCRSALGRGVLTGLALLAGSLFASGCRKPDDGGKKQVTPAASSQTKPVPRAPSAVVQPKSAARAPCRVVVGSGTLEETGEKLGPRAPLDGKRFVSLAEGERLSLRHERTSREFTLNGPGRFLPCFQGEEQLLAVRGSVTSPVGIGTHAGGEVVLATPFGVVKYADAELLAIVTEERLSLAVKAGEATFVPQVAELDSKKPPAPRVLRGPKGALAITKAVDAKLAVAQCRTAGDASRALSKPPRATAPTPSARASLGSWAVSSFEARRKARIACALARTASANLSEPERTRLWDLLESQDQSLDRRELRAGVALDQVPAEKK
jgi:hypothetical protein